MYWAISSLPEPVSPVMNTDASVAATLRAALPAETPVDVTLTWSPAWDSSMMSGAARRHFGW